MMKNRKENSWHGKIQYKNSEEYIENPADVEEKIREAQNKLAGDKGISDKLITLEVTSADVPDLTLIDLPGIVRVPLKGQPEDIGEQIKKLIRKFINKQSTVILVVVPCNVDIATTEALKMAQEVDPNGERTFGILTKPDLVDRGTEHAVVSIINNRMIYLTKGYMIVRCRGQQEITDHVPLYEATEKEKEFFENHSHFREMYREGKATIPNLAEKLTLELVHHIEKSPQLEEQIQMMLADTRAELDRYCSGPPTEPAERTCFLTDKITAFIQDAISLTTGEELKNVPRVNIFSNLRKLFDDWKAVLDKSEVTFNKGIEKELQEYDERYRGREFPGFLKYMTFEVIVKDQIRQLEAPAIRRLKEISDFIRREFIKLAQSHFEAFPNLLKMAKTKIESIKEVKESEAKSMLRTQFRMELMIYTQDSVYRDTLSKVRLDEEEAERLAHGVAQPATSSSLYSSDLEDTMEELTYHLKSYYRIARKRLADQVPLVIMYMVLQESAVQLQREMLQLTHNRNISELLREDEDLNSKRNHLKDREKRLMEALNRM